MVKKSIISLIISLSLVVVVLAGCSGGNASKVATPYEVKRGNLDIIVSSDGSLAMPNQFDLRFGTNGKVQDILVEEGDHVKQGAMLAFLDDTSQKNAIRTALFNLVTAINSVGENTGIAIMDPETCDPAYYYSTTFADVSGPILMEEAGKDLGEFQYYLENGLYKDAGFSLGRTYFDIEVCEELIKNKPDAATLAGAKPNQVFKAESAAGTSKELPSNEAAAIQSLQNYRDMLLGISALMAQGDYEKTASALDIAQQEMIKVKQLVDNTVHQKGWDYLSYPDAPGSLNFLQSSLRSLQELDDYAAQSDAKPDEIAKILYTAKLNLTIGHDILQNQTLDYVWGYEGGNNFNWKILQQYNLDVQIATISFLKAKQAIMNTVIIAPSDGTVVSVDLKKDYVLSAQDYSSRTAIKLVDTSTVKFTGMVDEIDILKVQPGQKATIAVDAVPDRTFTGTVKFISPFGAEVGNVVKFAITILLDPTDVELRGGLNATADISTYSAKNVLLVPISLVTFTPDGATVSLINEQTGQIEKRTITIGKQNLQFVEVVEGLKEGDKLAETKLNIFGIPSGTMGGGSNPGMMRVR